MNGWQRFGLLILGFVITLLLFPDYDSRGWTFLAFALLGGAAVLLVVSVLSNLFAIYRFELLNKIITIVWIGAIAYVMLWYFPLVEYKAPIYQLQAGRHPTQKDIARGLKRMTFNFDFVRRNVRRGENFKNQEIKPDKPQEKKAPKPKPEPEGNLQIDMDE